MSCNGCRVLRKGCGEDCPLRLSLQWIKSADSQANATLFLSKFYGRAGLLNLINAGSAHQRPEIFRSLLYDACGRIISPVYGSAGLMRSGDWKRCQAAVDAVLKGGQIDRRDSASSDSPTSCAAPLQGCDIRHLSAVSLRRSGTRRRGKSQAVPAEISFPPETEQRFTITGWSAEPEVDRRDFAPGGSERAASHDSFSVETVEPSLVNRVEKPCYGSLPVSKPGEIGLELTLGPGCVAGD